ncbi:VCBS domain-containing protein, partial [Vibrio splendidus]
DGTGKATVNVIVEGTNDLATVGDGSGFVKEDKGAKKSVASGTLSIEDVDAGEQRVDAYEDTANGYGKFSVDENGKWTFEIDNSLEAVQSLGKGDTETLTFEVTSVDGTGTGTVTVVVKGTNDTATVGEGQGDVDDGRVKEDAPTTVAEGKLTVSDADEGESELKPQTIENEYGTFKVNADGTWSFTIDNTKPAVQSLPEGEEVPLSFAVESLDGTGKATVNVIVEGTNDLATVDHQRGVVTEDKKSEVSGQLDISDADAGEALVVAQPDVKTDYGVFNLNADGSWSFKLDNDSVQSMAKGEKLVLKFPVESVDTTGNAVIKVVIKGANDAPELTVDTTGTLTEDASATLSTSGTLSVEDVDTTDDYTVDKSYNNDIVWSGGALTEDQKATLIAQFSVDKSGWDYEVANSEVDFLAEGETVTFSYDVIVDDGSGGTDTEKVTITLNGKNDAPELTAVTVGSVTEDTDSVLKDSGALSFTDKDITDTDHDIDATYKGDIEWDGGTLTDEQILAITKGFTVDGDSWDYVVANSDVDFLPDGDKVIFSYDVIVDDGKGGIDTETVTITINGTNDVATIDNQRGVVIEDRKTLVEGNLDISDDAGQAFVEPQNVKNEYGEFKLAADGTWSFQLDTDLNNTAVQSLSQGEKKVFEFDVVSMDKTGTATIKVVIKGTNDEPELTVEEMTSSITEDASVILTDSGSLSFSDIDAKDAHTIEKEYNDDIVWSGGTLTDAQKLVITNGFSIDSDSWDYSVANTEVDFLKEGDKVTFSYEVTVDDGKGGTDAETVTITITGTNDGPVAGNDFAALNDDATLKVDALNGVLSNDRDVDGGTLTVTEIRTGTEGNVDGTTNGSVGSDLGGTYGTLTLNADGSYTYVANNADSLKMGEVVTDTFTYTVDDGQGGTDTATLTITVTGTNDGPKANDDTYKAGSETILFTESFENMTNTNSWTVINGDQLEDWDATKGLEIQHESVVNKASDGEYIAELDAHQNTSITTSINTSGQDSARVEFDYNPRRDDNSSSDMKFIFGGETITVHADGTVSGTDISNVHIVGPDSNGWYKVTAEFAVQGDSVDLTFAGAGKSDSYGALLDNITVTGANDPILTTPEEVAIEITFAELLANDTDIDGDDLSIVLDSITSPTNGKLDVDYVNGIITFTPDKDYNGEATFKYKVTDGNGNGNGGEDEATVTLNVTPVNDLSVATDDTHTLGHNLIRNGSFESFTSSASKGWGDRASDVKHWDFNGPSGKVDVVDDGYLGVTTDGDRFIDMEGEGGRGDNVTLSQAVDGVEEGKPYQISLDVAARGENHTAKIQVVWNGVVIATITPDSNTMETHTFEVVGAAGDNTISFVEVGGAGDNSGTYLDNIKLQEVLVDLTTDEDTTLEIPHSQLLANDYDVDGDELEITSVVMTDSSHGTVEIVDGKVVFEPADNFNGVTTFEYTISDGKGGTDTAVVTINVKPVKDTVTVGLTGPDSVIEGDKTSPFTITLSEQVPEDSVVTLQYSYTNASNEDIVEVITVNVDANTNTATFEIQTEQDNEYEVGQEFNVSVVSVTQDDTDVFEKLDTSSADKNVAIDDSHDNPPKAEDFSISLNADGSSQVIFDTGMGTIEGDGTDHVSDNEDDNDNDVDTNLGVIITELPDSGTLYYVDGNNKVEVVVGQTYADPNNIVYEDDQESTGFFLGVDDTSTLDKGPHSTAEFHNWGDEVDAYTRELKFDNGDVVTITSEGRNNVDAKPLVQNNSQQGHMGFGIASTNRGIHQDEAINIDFSSRPADLVTVGLSGLGGWFAPNADDSVQSRAEITVTFDYGNGVTEEQTFLYDDTHNNQNVTIVAPEGAEIVSVEASTQGPGNWELTSLEAKASDSFEYKAVDSDGNESEVKTVTIDKSGDLNANNDPQGFEVKLGQFSEDNDSPWSAEGAELNASFNGQDKDFAHSGIKIGVAGTVGGLGAQIEYDRGEQQSEKFEINLDSPATQFTFSVFNLFKNEGNDGDFTDNHEQGSWVAYLNGVAVAGDTFIAEDGNNKGTYEITPLGPDGTPIAFDTVVFEATEYSNQATHDNDASDYFLTGFKASSEGAYAVNQGGILEIPTSKLAGIIGSELLNNDIDSDGDNLRITYVYGETEGNAYIKGGIVYFDLTGDDFVGETTFKYQVTDDNGQIASAEVNVIVNPLPTPSSVASVDLLADSVVEGDDLGFKVTLDSSALVESALNVTFGKNTDAANDSGEEKDLDLSQVRFTNGVTYDQQSGKLIVPVGVKDFAVLIPTLIDGVHELDENYSLIVDGVSATGIIVNVDTIELMVESFADVAEGSNAVFAVSLNNPSSENIDVSLAITLDRDATSAETADFKDIGELYTAYYLEPQQSGEPKRVELDVVIKGGKPTVTIPNGETEIFVEVATKDDPIFEGGEDFNLVVTDESGYVSNGSASDETTIMDDGTDPDGPDGPQVGNDDRPVVDSITDIEIEEGQSGTFVVELSNSSELETTIEMSLNDGSAVSVDGQPTEGDFNASSVIVSFGERENKQSETIDVVNGNFIVTVPDGFESFTVEVATNQDAHSDDSETFSISGNAPHQSQAVTGVATITDNEAPMVDLNGALYDIEYVSESAGYSNVFGYYINDDSGEKQLHVLVSNSNDPSLSPGTLLDSPLSSIDNLEFFLIPNGFNQIDSDKLYDLKVNDQGQLVVDGVVKAGISVYTSTDEDHQISTTVDSDGNLVLSFDDQKGQGNDDNDFNDFVVKVSKIDTDGIDLNSAYVEGGEAAIADIDADIFDDKDTIKSMSITLTNAKDGDNLTWAENSGFSVSKTVIGTAIALIITHPSGSVSADEFETFLKSIRFVNSSDTPDEEMRLVEVTVSDGVNQSETATASISVTGTDELSLNNVAGLEDQFIDLNISVVDAATSVSTIELSGIPQGATVLVGGVESTVDNNGTVVVDIDDIDSVKVKAPEHSDVNFDISVTAKDSDEETVESGSIYVDVHPDADRPTLIIGDFEKVAAIDFEDVQITSGSWDSDIEINNVEGVSTIGEWSTSNPGQHVEVGTEGTYLSGSSTNQVMEIEGEVDDKVLYTDMDLVAGRFYNFKFDIAARDDVDPSDSDMEVSLFKLDDAGNPIESSKVTLYDFIAERQGSGWQEGTFTLPVELSGKYRLVLEADEADSTGAIIDNIQFTAVDNYGYEDSFIKLSEISASLVDATDGSETLTVELEGLPAGSVLIDGTGQDANMHIVTEANKNDKIDVTGWDLTELQIKVLDPSTFDIKVIATATESDTNKDDDVHAEHGDPGGKLVNASEATINITVLEHPQGPVDTNERPTANDFTISSDTNVANINFAPNATDTEDDASSTDGKYTSVRIEELPEYGKLYEVNEQGEIIGDALAIGTIILDSANIIYVANGIDDVEIGSDFTDVNFVVDNELNARNNQPGVDRLDIDGVVVAGVLFDGSTFSDGNATIKYDHNPNQLGVFVHTNHDSGTGSETGIGEYISFASDRGNISSAEIYLSSLQGLLGNGNGNGNNQQSTAKLVAYLFDNGQQVGGPIELPLENVNHSAHTASVDVSSDSVTFDEVRLAVVNPSNSGQGAGFNVSAIEFDVNGVVDIQDEFKYSAIDSKPQDSLSQGTVTINATSIIGAVSSGIDHVTVTGNNMVWNQSAAHTWETESSSLLGYDELDGTIINVGVGGDSVNMGAGSDTVYMGDSIVPGMDQNVNIDNQNAAIDRLIHADINGSTATTADDMTYGDEDYHHKLESYSNAGVDIVQSGGGNDTVYGEEGVDLIFGGTGHDVLNGGSGDDAVRGGSGNDTLVGGLGDDILVGDDGTDLFQWVDQPFQGDVDTITDFALGEDHLDISQLLPTENSMSDLLEHITIEKVDNGGGDKDLVITISEDANSGGQTQTIILDNTRNQFDSVNAQGDGSVISSDLSNLVNQLFVNLPD